MSWIVGRDERWVKIRSHSIDSLYPYVVEGKAPCVDWGVSPIAIIRDEAILELRALAHTLGWA
jgi:hypothetical protein